MEAKSSVIQPSNEWRSRMKQLIRTQMDMEKKWNQMKEKDGFMMKELDVSHIGDQDDADNINIVVISDTHSAHNRISVPPGNLMNISVSQSVYNHPFLIKVTFSFMPVTSQSMDWSLRLSPSTIGWPHCLTR